MCVFGTRPEAIKFAPVLNALKGVRGIATRTVLTAQHTDLLDEHVREAGIVPDVRLDVRRRSGSLNELVARVMDALDQEFENGAPDLVLVQGDTSSALAAAMAAFHRWIPVGHIEAGLRSGVAGNPFPEEMNRRLVTRIADMHFAATPDNAATLLEEDVPRSAVFVTGNPIVDQVRHILETTRPSRKLQALLRQNRGQKIVAVTMHRREAQGKAMAGALRALRQFCADHADISIVFPVHPSPAVRKVVESELGGRDRVHLIPPLGYRDFIHLLRRSWLIASDSGGVQEEAPTLGRPLIVLRDNTERPEAVECGTARLAGLDRRRVARHLELAYADAEWATIARKMDNPFGSGDAGRRIAHAIKEWLKERPPSPQSQRTPATERMTALAVAPPRS